MRKEGTHFIEVQRVRQWWIWLIALGTVAIVAGVFSHALFQQLVWNQPWGDQPMSDVGLVVVAALALALSLGLVWLLLAAQLEVIVGEEELSIHFHPFPARRIQYGDIRSVEATKYRPVLEYGGWGIRWAPGRGIAYNASGNQGVLLELAGGKRVLVGSQDPQELAGAIRERVGRKL